MTQADILAIKVAVTNVTQAQQQLRAVKSQLDRLNQATAAAGRQQQSMVQRLRQLWGSLRSSERMGVQSAVGSWGRLAATFAGVTAAAGTLYAAIKAFETLDVTTKGLSSILGEETAASILKQARSLADMTGMRALDLLPQMQKLAGTGEFGDQDLIPTMRAFMALGKKSGASPAGLGRAFEQFSQIASQGKLQGDELRSIQENGVQLRKLLKDAGLGPRVGSQTDPITFKEIQDVLLQFGRQAKANDYLLIGSNNASAALNRLMNVVQLDVLPVLGKMLTPAVVELANLLRTYMSSLGEARLRELGRNTAKAVFELGKLALEALPTIVNVIQAAAPVIAGLIQSFRELNELTGGKLLNTLLLIAGVRVATGAVAGAAGGAVGGAIGGYLTGTLVPALLGAVRKLIAAALYQGVGLALRVGLTWLAGALATLGTAVAGASAAIVGAVVAVGAAIGLVIGHLINQIPSVHKAQNKLGEWIHDTFGGGAEARAKAAMPAPEWQPGGRLYEMRQARQSGFGETMPSAQSARRSDPQRLMNEAGANGLRYSR